MIVDEKSVYDKELQNTAGKFEEVESEKTQISDNPKVEIVQKSGDKPTDITVRNLMLVEAERAALSPETTQPESAPPGQETSAPSGVGGGGEGRESGSSGPVPSLSETGIGTGTVPGAGIGTGPGTSTGTGTGIGTGPGAGFGTSTRTSTSTSTGTKPASPTSSGSVPLVSNEGGHDRIVDKVAAYVVPLVAAILL